MSCRGCGKQHKNTVQHTVEVVQAPVHTRTTMTTKAVGASDSNEKVRVRYYGGGFEAKPNRGCSSCGKAKGSYARVTNETIIFASDDAENGLFKLPVEIGHDYWVTEKQAEYMTSDNDDMVYTNPSGQLCHKFKLVG